MNRMTTQFVLALGLNAAAGIGCRPEPTVSPAKQAPAVAAKPASNDQKTTDAEQTPADTEKAAEETKPAAAEKKSDSEEKKPAEADSVKKPE